MLTLLGYEQGATMPITIPINLTPVEEAALVARANAEGVSIESLLHEAVLHLIATGQSEVRAPLTTDQWGTELMEWLDSMPDVPSLYDEAFRRESSYTREDEWR
jgi:hypothetical protein